MAKRCRVICIETGKIYNSAADAAKDVGLKNNVNITNCCKGKAGTAAGYHWEYYEEPNLPNEIWKDAKCVTDGILYDFTGRFLVSNKGRVKNILNRQVTYGSATEGSYKRIQIDSVLHSVHRMVATTFIPNPENKPTVDHINTIRTDNRVENLRWFTQSEQMNDNEITRERHRNSSKRNAEIANNSTKKKVYCITTNRIFNSIRDAMDEYNIKCSAAIGECCSSKRGYAGKLSDGTKLKWEYYIEED